MNLVVDISAHGFGHIAMTGPVLGALMERVPNLRITVRCAAPREVLEARIPVAFAHVAEAFDFGMRMKNAVDVDVPASAAMYVEAHRDWDRKVEREAVRLAALAPDLLLSNIPYLSLAAAAKAGVPRVALSCLDWADIYEGCCASEPSAAEILAQMRAAYASAPFIQAEPSMPMPWLSTEASSPGVPRVMTIGPIASIGRDRRAEIDAKLGLRGGERLALIGLGGVPMRLPMEQWPAVNGVRWIVPAAWAVQRADTVAFESLEMPFRDVLRSSEVVIAKPGYGTFTEAACSGVAVLYVMRPFWPEAPVLVRWLETHGRCLEIERGRLERGDLAGPLDALLGSIGAPGPSTPSAPPPPRPTGAEEGAQILASMLRGDAR